MKRMAMILIGWLLLLASGAAQEKQMYFTLPQIKEQAAEGWHACYVDRYDREVAVDIDIEVFGEEKAPVLKIGLPDYVEYRDNDKNPFALADEARKYGGTRMRVDAFNGERIDLDHAYGAEYGNDLTLREAYAFLKEELSRQEIAADFVYDLPEEFYMIYTMNQKTGEILYPAFYGLRLWPKFREMPVLTHAMNSFGKHGWPFFEPKLFLKIRNREEYSITVRTCDEQEAITEDIPLCALEKVIGSIEKKIEEGYIQDVISLRFGYSIYNDPQIQSRKPVAYDEAACYYAVPSWVLECKIMKNPEKASEKDAAASCLTINAQTGEFLNYSDTSKFGFADADYKGVISWNDVE